MVRFVNKKIDKSIEEFVEEQLVERPRKMIEVAKETFPEAKISDISPHLIFVVISKKHKMLVTPSINRITIKDPLSCIPAYKLAKAYERELKTEFTVYQDYGQ